MEDMLISLLVLGVLGLAWLGWRHYRLKREIAEITTFLQQAGQKPQPARQMEDLPLQSADLGILYAALQKVASACQNEYDEANAERTRLAAIVDQITDGMLIADSDGLVQTLNPAAEKLFGKRSALQGKSVTTALRNHHLVETWQKCRANGKIQTKMVELPASHKFLQITVLPDLHTGGSLILVQDFTKLRRLETVRRDFISNISHELRTPLASLKALTETLQEGALEDPPAARRFLSRIQTEVDALTQMTAELLELSRIESGQVPYQMQEISPAMLIHEAAERMSTQAERAGVALTSSAGAEKLPHIVADPMRLQQVFINLVHNAIKFTPPGGEIHIAGEVSGENLLFSVSDTGTGIPDEEQERIFERFYKTDRSRASGGTGLGLSIARHIVEAHNGRIWVQSREGRGSVFFIEIPASLAA